MIRPSFLLTHPHPAIRRWFYGSAACPGVLAAANLYSRLRYLVPSDKVQGGEWAISVAEWGGAIQDGGYGLRRIILPRTSVNKGKSKPGLLEAPALMMHLTC